jgi:hypothetical protein
MMDRNMEFPAFHSAYRILGPGGIAITPFRSRHSRHAWVNLTSMMSLPLIAPVVLGRNAASRQGVGGQSGAHKTPPEGGEYDRDAFYFGNFARQFALAPETSDGPVMQAAE